MTFIQCYDLVSKLTNLEKYLNNILQKDAHTTRLVMTNVVRCALLIGDNQYRNFAVIKYTKYFLHNNSF